MGEQSSMLKNALIAVGAGALLVIGLGIIIYVNIARDRIAPTPTPRPSATLALAPATTTAGPKVSPTQGSQSLTEVSGVVREYSAGALIIMLTPDSGTVEQIIVPENVEVVSAAGRRASPNEIVPGQRLRALGELDALNRLIAQQIILEGPTPTPRVQPSGTPTPVTAQPTATVVPSPTAWNGWLGEYFGNPELKGTPVLTRADVLIDFQWQKGSPAPQVPVDGFSVRWRGKWTFDEGGYRFYAYTDDGVRVWVDGVLIIDQWRDQPAALSSAEAFVPQGDHELRVEYYDHSGDAIARVWWDFMGAYPDWKAEYYGNKDLSGQPALVRNDADLRFNWGAGSPAASIPTDRFSARWVREVQFSEDAYRFMARADDGMRVWVDNLLIIDEWHASSPDTYVGYIWLDGGPHEVKVEYFEEAGDAAVELVWQPIDRFDHWQAEYYANAELKGRPVFMRDDAAIDFNWGDGSPGRGIPIDNFSVRWLQNVTFVAGNYTLWAEADDGVRLYVDGALLIDDWTDSPLQRFEVTKALTAGSHLLEVEYFERGGQAIIRMGWAEALTPTPSVTPTVVPATAVPTFTPAPQPTATVTNAPTATTQPTAQPTLQPTAAPTATPTTASPTATFTSEAPTATSEPPTPTSEPSPPSAQQSPTEQPTPCETCEVEQPQT
jgi:hypothetical protein